MLKTSSLVQDPLHPSNPNVSYSQDDSGMGASHQNGEIVVDTTKSSQTNPIPVEELESTDVVSFRGQDRAASSSSSSCTNNKTTTTISLCQEVRSYLKSNQIKWHTFSKLVLGVSQSKLSTLLSNPKPWNLLNERDLSYYERLQEWMETRATYGNNPYCRQNKKPAGQGSSKRGRKKVRSMLPKKPRSLLEKEDDVELLSKLEEITAGAGQNIMDVNDNALEKEQEIINEYVVYVEDEVFFDLSGSELNREAVEQSACSQEVYPNKESVVVSTASNNNNTNGETRPWDDHLRSVLGDVCSQEVYPNTESVVVSTANNTNGEIRPWDDHLRSVLGDVDKDTSHITKHTKRKESSKKHNMKVKVNRSMGLEADYVEGVLGEGNLVDGSSVSIGESTRQTDAEIVVELQIEEPSKESGMYMISFRKSDVDEKL